MTAQGTLSYFDRDNTTLQPAGFMTAYLYDSNPGATDELLATTSTQPDGSFQFPSVRNWKSSGTPRDLYVVWETAYNDSGNTYVNPTRRVADLVNHTYKYFSADCVTLYGTDCPDATVNFSSNIPVAFPNLEAMWIFQDLRRGWMFMMGQTGTDPGSSTAKWQIGQNALSPCNGSCFYAGLGGPYVFIADGSVISADTIIHELGHNYMDNATGYWLWGDPVCILWPHSIFSSTDPYCAWSEGWADFFPLPVNSILNPNVNDTCYDFGIGPCGAGGGVFENLEQQWPGDGRNPTDWVEGRVAGGLYDLFDQTNDGFDQIGFGFVPIWNIVRTKPSMFADFWNTWKANGYEKHFAVQSIYQNTIDYDAPPAFNNLPTITLLQGITYNHAVDLWFYASDQESTNSQMTYALVSVTDARCGASVSTHYVNFAVQPGWSGACNVTVLASDNIKATNGTFLVNVVPVRARIYLPLILK